MPNTKKSKNKAISPFYKTASIMILTAAIAGCSSISDNSYKKPKADDIAKGVGAPEQWVAPVIDKNITIDWLDTLNDPTLKAFIAEGKAKNLDLKLAAANVQKANLLASKSATTLKPTANVALSSNNSGKVQGASSPTSSSVAINASWEFDVWGRLQAGIDAANASAQVAQADYQYAIHSLSANIAKTYFKVIEAKQQADITKKNLQLLSKMMRITQAKYDNGIASGQDVAINKANLASAKDQLIELQGSERNALRALELLLGRYPDATSEIPSTLPLLPPQPPAGIPSSILERRPDLISAERNIAAAFNATQQAKTARLPSFSLTGAINGASSSLTDILNPANLAWQLASNIAAPLFDAGRAKIDIAVASTEQQQAITNYAKQALTAFSEVENNLDQGVVLSNRELELERVVSESQKAFKIVSLRYKEGEIGLLDTLNVQQQTISAQSSLLSLKRLQLEQRINLYLALGGDW
jgi:NodT family efflux transporter outer membrane factor (OMF) lipoprotein